MKCAAMGYVNQPCDSVYLCVCVYVCVFVSERERERNTETETETESGQVRFWLVRLSVSLFPLSVAHAVDLLCLLNPVSVFAVNHN